MVLVLILNTFKHGDGLMDEMAVMIAADNYADHLFPYHMSGK